MKRLSVIVAMTFGLLSSIPANAAEIKKPVAETRPFSERCTELAGKTDRLICADVAAVDQTIVYNRFGSFDPFGMIFVLRRDLVPMNLGGDAPLPDCSTDLGAATAPPAGDLRAGQVRLRDCERPRPLVLRANVGDRLLVRVTNYMAEPVPDFSANFCGNPGTSDPRRAAVRAGVSTGDEIAQRHGEVACATNARPDATRAALPDWPRTRGVNFTVQGLHPLPIDGQEPHRACLGLASVPPGESFECLYDVALESTYFLASNAAPAGGQGDGGSITHGLFGAVLAERPGTRWYRSQVSRGAFDAFWPPATNGPRHSRAAPPDYEAVSSGVPVLNMLRPLDVAQADFRDARALELVHADLNAVVMCDEGTLTEDNRNIGHCAAGHAPGANNPTTEPKFNAFREFTVFFHDELKTFYTRNFEELGKLKQLAGARDGFAINYGSSGMGALVLANRKGIGPAASCVECLYEEFFLTSWANGDPALLEWFDDDPANTHHSYLNDPVVFRNFHAGPKETHVFHLHAHQWFAGNDPGRGSYLDSQTVAPQQGFSYNIYSGGLNGGRGGWQAGGTGNRNRTPGDSIFHCHLYPHFAQGMWALWRVHDVLEDGTRRLPDGQDHAGLSLDLRPPTEWDRKRTGSVDKDGRWIAPSATDPLAGHGTPIPGLIPLPGEPLPLLPTYTPEPGPAPETKKADVATGGPERLFLAAAAEDAPTEAAPPDAGSIGMPGYPFYIAGQAGHRAPQAPMDIARDGDELLSGGLGRHVVTGGERKFPLSVEAAAIVSKAQKAAGDMVAQASDAAGRAQAMQPLEPLYSQLIARAFALGDLTAELTGLQIDLLDPDGTPLERAAMGFHHDGKVSGATAPRLELFDAYGTTSQMATGGYSSPLASVPDRTPPATVGRFEVNGAPPAPGAPFADPCGGASRREGTRLTTDLFTGTPNYAADRDLTGFRRYEVSAVQLDLIVNRAGWHDPQARIDVLTERSHEFKADNDRISPVIRDDEEPFFFRAMSGECIEFRHTNELPKDLALDDFQVKTPTDTIGQHIHLVKFDVTSSDGSANGWNYEDGTFAPDELMARRCAAGAGLAENPAWGTTPPTAEQCAALHDGKYIWRLPLADNRALFQTTTQRWFADPILTRTENGREVDRTLRTVFSHDHFGASSIQQHGFYAALLIEPSVHAPLICADASNASCEPLAREMAQGEPRKGEEGLLGTRKWVRFPDADGDPLHSDYQEFALAIADFALLYDPRDRRTAAEATGPDSKGMGRLVCEARHRNNPGRLKEECGTTELARDGNDRIAPGETPPAWLAAGRPGDTIHRGPDLIAVADVETLDGKMRDHRARAAGMDPARAGTERVLASPVAPPDRAEAVSVDHHDPYLVNYRNAPIPLRIGTKDPAGKAVKDCAPLAMNPQRSEAGARGTSPVMEALENGTFPECSYAYQIAGPTGDIGNALSSWGEWGADTIGNTAGRDPETPVFEAVAGPRIVLRLIQGAHEVQHSFTVAGRPFKRNMDQAFPQGMIDRASTLPSPRKACFEALRHSRPEEYEAWLRWTPARADATPPDFDAGRWAAFQTAFARCDNIEGYTYAQEIGISEHFEMQGRMRSDMAQVEYAPGETTQEIPVEDGSAGPDKGSRERADYLYHFGSTNALWNGAWGLIRVSRDTGNPTESIAPDVDTADTADAVDTASAQLSCPVPREGRSPNHTQALVVALRTAEIWPDHGTDYGNGMSDPYGLMLAQLPSDALDVSPDAPGVEKRNFLSLAGWEDIPRQAVLDAVKTHYGDRPEPFVMRVNAGDCVVLRLINLLPGDDWTGLPALPGDPLMLGDAPMPPIAALNTNPGASIAWDDGRTVSASLTRPEGRLVRPSARLGLSVGLPGAELIRNLPLGYGINRVGLEGQAGATVKASAPMAFYAGRMRLDVLRPPGNPQSDATIIEDEVNGTLDHIIAGDDPQRDDALARLGLSADTLLVLISDNQAPTVDILGQGYNIGYNSPDGASGIVDSAEEGQPLLRWMRGQIAQAVDRHTHWIPYAFGPVPLRATGDMITQTPHGLFGVIDVLPEHWPIKEMRAVPEPALPSGPHRRTSGPALGFGAPMTFDLTGHADPGLDAQPYRIREFVLFYQDGLNLRDRASQLVWNWADNGQPAEDPAFAGRHGPLVPNCHVCDDNYDLGDAGVSYRSAAFAPRLRAGVPDVEASDDFNRLTFPPGFFAQDPLTLRACDGDRVVIRVVHPGGRARQRAFVMNGYGYDDLFPGFGFPHSALLAPGKAVSAWLDRPFDPAVTGLWHDGPTSLVARGTWGVVAAGADECEG